MPRIAYIQKNFQKSSLVTISQAMEIIEEYKDQGFTLTLRQLYYQFVARDFIPNKQKEYNRLGSIISDAIEAGYIDWNAIEDRTRNLEHLSHWDNPEEIIESSAYSYRIDKWERQPVHVEAWVEKDALTGVLEPICNELDIPFFSCRGYVSQSEMWKAARRLGRKKYLDEKERIIVLHLGDHDPSGIDMTRDIELRLNHFAVTPEDRQNMGYDPEEWTDPEWVHYFRNDVWPVEVKRIGLNMDQIRQLNPPPNPAKSTDSRFREYMKKHGSQSWELDALEPRFITNLIRTEVESIRDDSIWEEDVSRETQETKTLQDISNHFDDVAEFIKTLTDEED